MRKIDGHEVAVLAFKEQTHGRAGLDEPAPTRPSRRCVDSGIASSASSASTRWRRRTSLYAAPLREWGAVPEHATHDEARVALVRSWAEATRDGKSALLVATRSDDVRALNELARSAIAEALGEERLYATDFGERAFAIGDVLVGRERAHGGVNGDLYTLSAHRDDGWLELVRTRDDAHVVRDLHEHRSIDYGYATTSYCSQGRTVDAVFALASPAEARRGLYVDVTRAREDVTIAYGKDDVRDFGDLLVRAQRDNGKVLVSDVQRVVALRREVEREEEKLRRTAAIKLAPEHKIGHGRGHSR